MVFTQPITGPVRIVVNDNRRWVMLELTPDRHGAETVRGIAAAGLVSAMLWAMLVVFLF